MANIPNIEPSRIKIYEDTSGVEHKLTATYLIGDDGLEKDWNDIKAISALQTVTVTYDEFYVGDPTATPPVPPLYPNNASLSTENKIYLVPTTNTPNPQFYEMWLTTDDDGNPPVYSWVSLGTTSVDLSGYSLKTHTHTATIPSMTIAGTASGVTIGPTSNGTKQVISALGTTTTETVLKDTTTFTPSVTLSKKYLAASHTNVALSPTTDKAIKSITPTTETVLPTTTTFSTTVTPSKTFVKATASGTAISSNSDNFVKSYPGVTNTLATTSIKGVSGTTTVATVTSSGSAGDAPIKGISVDNDGVLSFVVGSAATLPTFGTATVATANTNATTVATGSLGSGGATILTGLGTAVTSSALTSASVSQPDIKLESGDVVIAENDPSNSSFSVLCDTAISGQAKPKLYGKSAVINQLIEHGNFDEAPTHYNNTVSVSGNELTSTVTANGGYWGASNLTLINGHRYFFSVDCTQKNSSSVRTVLFDGGSILVTPFFYISVGNSAKFYTATVSSSNIGLYVYGETGQTDKYKNFMYLDLTAIFGSDVSSITDVATLKTAWLKKFGYPLPQYIDYDEGSIVSNNAVYQLHGRNLWEAQDASNLGVTLTVQEDGGIKLVGQASASYNFAVNKTLKAGTYTLTCGYSGSLPSNSSNRVQAVGGGLDIGVANNQSQTQYYTGTLSEDSSVELRVRIHSGFTYDTILYPQLELGSTSNTYEAPYDGGSVTADSLNGIGTAVDSQDADGQIVRKIVTVDLGSKNWTYENNGVFMCFQISDYKAGSIPVCTKYVGTSTATDNMNAQTKPDKSIYFRSPTADRLYCRDTAYTDAAAFKTSLNGVMLAYELATPTTDTTTAASLTTQEGYNSLEPVSGDVQSADAEVEYWSGEASNKDYVEVADGITSASTSATGSATVIKNLGTPTRIDAVTNVTVSSQPEVSLSLETSSATGRVQIPVDVASATISVTAQTAEAITDLGTESYETVLSGVEVKTQPTVYINGKASETVAQAGQITTSQDTSV